MLPATAITPLGESDLAFTFVGVGSLLMLKVEDISIVMAGMIAGF